MACRNIGAQMIRSLGQGSWGDHVRESVYMDMYSCSIGIIDERFPNVSY